MRTDGASRAGPSRALRRGRDPLEVLAESALDAIHLASLEILERTGVRFASAEAIRLFERAGARVEGERVYLDRQLLRALLAAVPASFVLHGRNAPSSVPIGGDACVVMPGGGPAFLRDCEGVRRTGRLEDVRRIARIVQASPLLHIAARKAVEAQDVAVPLRHVECWHAVLSLTDKPAQSGFVGGRAEAEDALQMLALAHGGEDAIDGRPVAQCSVNVNSPLSFDTPMVESLISFARLGQPVLVSPFVMAGVTGPASMAGAVAQQNAEVLAGVALTQLVRAGSPAVYGSATSNVDLRTGSPAIGGPESALATAACAQLARRYRLPCRAGGALTDSPVPDAQSQYERMFTLMNALLCGVHFLMHGVGILESYLTFSEEQLVIDLEMLEMLEVYLAGFEVDAEHLAIDTVHGVGPGGMFLDAPHTLARYRDAFWAPVLGRRQSYEQWRAAGGEDTLARARRLHGELLESWIEPSMDSECRLALENFVDRRRATEIR